MNSIKYSDDEKIKICNEAKESGNIAATAKRYNIGDSAIHDWMRKFSISKVNKIKTKNESQEIKRLKKLLADKELENSILKDLVKKTVQVWSNEGLSLMNTSPNTILNQKF